MTIDHAPVAPLSAGRRRRRGQRRRPGTLPLVAGAAMLGALVLAAVLVPLVTGTGLDEQGPSAFLAPSLAHPFGTDEVGRDIFVRSFYGLQMDLLLVFVAVPVSMVLGTFIGMLRALDVVAGELGQRFLDIILGFPAIVLGLCVAAVLGPGFPALLVALVVVGLPPFGRLARSSLLTLESMDFIQAAHGFGASRIRILLRHYLPNSSGPLLTQLAISLVSAVMLEAALSVIGLGLQPPRSTLGALISSGLPNVYTQLWYVIGPMLLLVALAVSLSLLADGIKERFVRR